MGLYPINCSECKKLFMWFSGNPDQQCHDCKNKSTEKTDFKITETIIIENSSNIAAISYTDVEAMLVKFKNGGEYLYKKVPKEIYETITKAQSAGKYLNTAVIGKFEYEKLEPLKKEEKADEQ